jgi:CRISPR/Cas system CSM-associated protein Csm3 (group 7 of RAMP superfamily)
MAAIHITITLHSGMRLSDDVRGAAALATLPATQLKGRLRASCEHIARLRGWPVCGAPEQRKMCHDNPCTICRLFGSPWREGMLYCHDLTATEPPVLNARTRATRSRRRGVVTDIETQPAMIVPAGAQFRGAIHYDFAELALLALTVAGLHHIDNIGGGWAAGDGLCMVSTEARDRNNRPIPPEKLADALRNFQPEQRSVSG